jgi:hypothetical protein
VGDHPETFSLTLRSQLELLKAESGKGGGPLEPKTGTQNVRWVSPAHSATELSGNGTPLRHATRLEVKNLQRWIAYGVAVGLLKRS